MFLYFANREFDVCNWLIPFGKGERFCVAYQLNRTIPYLSDRQNYQKWKNLK